jgi:hypothetical protein
VDFFNQPWNIFAQPLYRWILPDDWANRIDAFLYPPLDPDMRLGTVPTRGRAPVVGSYRIDFESGMSYIGKGRPNRPKVSARTKEKAHGDKAKKTDYKPARDELAAFKAEAQRLRNAGGVPNPNLYNKINSPGERFLPPPKKPIRCTK